jgi:UDP-N-acetylmuramate dehydrogenase
MIEAAFDATLEHRNTLRLPARAAALLQPTTLDELRAAVEWALARPEPIALLGGGSNVVLQARLNSCVIVPALAFVRVERHDTTTLVTAGAGVVWHDLVRFCLGQGLYGLENLALIPGCVGAAPIQNIGAYGVELERVFESLTAISCRDASSITMLREECGFGYRDSIFKRARRDELAIASVTLRLESVAHPCVDYPDVRRELSAMGRVAAPVAVAEAVTRIRRSKLPDPRIHPNAGSFFKNPVLTQRQLDELRGRLPNVPMYATELGVKVAAAYLIDAAGWKGRALGPAAVWHRQPLVLINRGGARAADMLQLADAIRDDVGARYGVALEMEPVLLGND